jgi:hypothetical protein
MTTNQPKPRRISPSFNKARELFEATMFAALQLGERWELEFDDMPEWPEHLDILGRRLSYRVTSIGKPEEAVISYVKEGGFIPLNICVTSALTRKHLRDMRENERAYRASLAA